MHYVIMHYDIMTFLINSWHYAYRAEINKKSSLKKEIDYISCSMLTIHNMNNRLGYNKHILGYDVNQAEAQSIFYYKLRNVFIDIECI